MRTANNTSRQPPEGRVSNTRLTRPLAAVLAFSQFILVLGLVTGCALLDKGTYEKAEGLFVEGHYGEAAALYEKIPTYADAMDKLRLCENHGRYAEAAGDFENGRYAEAAALFVELGDFLDSADWGSLAGLAAAYGDGGVSGGVTEGGASDGASDGASGAGGGGVDGGGDGGAVIISQEDYRAFSRLIEGGAPGAAAKAAAILAAIDTAAWVAASGEDTAGAYEDYLARWPDGAHRGDCAAAIENLVWTDTAETDTVAGYLGYVERYPDGAHADEARSGIERLAWEAAVESGNVSAFEAYLAEYGDEAHAGEARDSIVRLREAAYDNAISDNTISALSAFLAEWPDTERRDEIERLIEALKADRSLSEPLLSAPLDAEQASIDAFLTGYPGHADEARVRELLTRNEGDIAELLSDGVIAVAITGQSITDTRLGVTNNTRIDASVAIPYGTYFAANSGSVQNMVVREEQLIYVPAGGSASVSVSSACMNIRRAIPDASNSFQVKSLGGDARLTKLMRVLGDNGCAYPVAQAAVWIVTDNPGDYALTETLVYSDGGRAIGEEDLAEAKEMVRLALE